jgi:hypothetical protein
MDYYDFKTQARELALVASMQYNESPDGDIWLVEQQENGNLKSWFANRGWDGGIESVSSSDGHKDWKPDVWLLWIRNKKRNED